MIIDTAACLVCNGLIPRPSKLDGTRRKRFAKYCSKKCRNQARIAGFSVEQIDEYHAYMRRKTRQHAARKRRATLAAAALVRARYPQRATCIQCGTSFPLTFNLNGTPRKHQSRCCSKHCEYMAWKAPRRPAPFKPRPCKYCRRSFIPPHNDYAFYCSKRCKADGWAKENPERIRASYRLSTQREALARAAYRASEAGQRQRLLRALIRALRLALRSKKRAEAHARLQLLRCRGCDGPISARVITKRWCEACQNIRFIARKKKTQLLMRKRDREQLRRAYVVRRLQRTTGLSPQLITPTILQAKRDQLILYRTIKETKNAIREARPSAAPSKD